MSKSVVVKTTTVQPKSAPAVRKVVRVISEKQSQKSRGNGRQAKKRVNMNPAWDQFSQKYARSLCDPFDVAPDGLGLGTLIPTTILTAYLRGSFVTNADGSFQIVLNPSMVNQATPTSTSGGFVTINNTATAVAPTWTTALAAFNQLSINSDFDMMRCLSGGLRIIPDTNFSSNPGMFYAGVIAPSAIEGGEFGAYSGVPGTIVALGNFTTSSLITLPCMELYRAFNSVEITWRPSELSDYDFDGFATTAVLVRNQVPVLVAAGSGLPASSTVFFDSVFHYEGYDTQKFGSINHSYAASSSTAASAGYPSIDSVWQKTSKFLDSTTKVVGTLYQAGKLGTELMQKANSTYGGLFPRNGSYRSIRYTAPSTVDLVKSTQSHTLYNKDPEEYKEKSPTIDQMTKPGQTSLISSFLGR